MNDASLAEPPRLNRTAAVAFFVVAALIPIAFALITDHSWEDFFITFRHSRNLVEGHGLVFQPGERVHGFTSPLGVLLPALGYWITGGGTHVGALWFLRILGSIALAGAGTMLLRIAAAAGAGRLALGFLAVLLLFDIKGNAFAINGMETAFLILFVVWGFSIASKDVSQSWLANGACWAGLMWTRPDGCVYIAVLALLALNYGAGELRPRLIGLGKSGLVCTFLYGPWFLWAWSYYGSPVPNTILAKVRMFRLNNARPNPLARMLVAYPDALPAPFRPIYFDFGGWSPVIQVVCVTVAIICAVYWTLRVDDRIGKMASMGFCLLSVYLAYVTILFPWYLPPAAFLGYLALTLALNKLAVAVPSARLAAYAVAGLLCAGQIYLFATGGLQLGIRQAAIERDHRIVLSLWLKDHVQPGERVYVEPLGFIGFFSEAKMLDYPGLASREVGQAIDQFERERRDRSAADEPKPFVTVGLILQPEWMVLRPWEEKEMCKEEAFVRDYKEVKVFDARPRLAEYPAVPGRPYLEFDAVYHIYRRQPPNSN